MPRTKMITLPLKVWVDMRLLIDQERDTMFAVIQRNDSVHYLQTTRLEQKIDKLTRENVLLKNCLCDDCRVKRNTKKQIKIEGKGLQL